MSRLTGQENQVGEPGDRATRRGHGADRPAMNEGGPDTAGGRVAIGWKANRAIIGRFAAVFHLNWDELFVGPAMAIVAGALVATAVGLAVGAGLLAQQLRDLDGIATGVTAIQVAGNAAYPVTPSVTALVGQLLVDNAVYALTMLPFPLIVWIFAGALVMEEKLSGTVETLLATPISLVELWFGKTAAMTAAGTAMAWIAAGLGAAGAHIAVALALGRAGPPLSAPAAAAAFILNPLLFSGMCGLTIAVALTKSAENALLPSFLIGMGAMMILPIGVGTGSIVIGSWSFCLYQAGAAVLLWAAVWTLVAGAKKEHVVLSGRE